MKVEDIMTKEVITVAPETKVTEVAKILFEHNFNGIPVVGADKKVLGLVTESDLLTRDSFGVHIPSLIKFLADFKALNMLKGETRKELESILNADAQSIMNKDYAFARPQSTVMELTEIFEKKQANPVLVIGEDRTLEGIVSRSDIVKLVSKIGEVELDFLVKGN